MIEKLLELQERDVRIAQIERELADIPRHKEEIGARLGDSRKALAETREKIKAEQAKLKGFDLEIETRRERIKKLLIEQGSLKTNKEYQAMTLQIRAVEQEIARLEDQVLLAWETMEALAAECKARENALRTEEERVQRDVRSLDERAALLQKEQEGLRAERAALATTIEADWLAAYEQIMANKKDRAVVRVEDGVCGGCHMTLPPYLKHEARKRNERVFCTFCGRMLYA